MKKGKKRCGDPACLKCRLWPKLARSLGFSQACYWIDPSSGEVFIATGLRALPGGRVVEIEEQEGHEFYACQCECGAEMVARGDILDRGWQVRCNDCTATLVQCMRN